MLAPMQQPFSHVHAGPDRILTRAAVLVLVIWCVLLVTAGVLLDHALRVERMTAAVAVRSEAIAGRAGALLGGLEIMARLPSRDVPETVHARAVRDAEAFKALLAEVPAEAVPAGILSKAHAASQLVLHGSAPGMDVTVVRDQMTSEILPALEAAAAQDRTVLEAAVSAQEANLVVVLTLQLLVTVGLSAMVLIPARAGVLVWMEERAASDRENRFRLLHDALTDLPNETYLHAHLAQVARETDRSESHTAVLRIDIDRYGLLKGALGKRATDEILRVAARRLHHALRTRDFAARFGQDGFAIVVEELGEGNDVATVVSRIQTALGRPYALSDGAREITCCIGVTLASDDEAEPDRILANAGIALAEAQAAGPGSVRYFREKLRREVETRATLYGEMLAGLDRGEFQAVFQPQLSLATDGFAGFEALVRWNHPERGLLTPAEFLDFADETELTGRIGARMLTQALQALKAWDAAGLSVPRVGVNFAMCQLRDPRLIEKIKWEIERFDVDPARLSIEVLETVLIKSDSDLVVRNLRGLASAGVGIDLDDFGTGHASIANLRRFAVDRIKIDRSFIAGIEASAEQQKLTASMIAMADALGLKTLAEGVETEAAVATLRRLGCDELQGFVFAHPMPLSATFSWLERQRAAM